MASIVINGDTSGAVTLQAPAVAGTTTLTLPTTSGTIALTSGSTAFTNLTVTNDATISGLTVGKGAGAVSTNTAVGASALAGNSTGGTNTAIGYQAGLVNTVSNQTFVGYAAGVGTTSGAANTALGSIALYTNSTGAYNTALGAAALFSNTTASYNTAVGYQAGYSYNGSDGRTTAIGYKALYSTTGGFNTAVGNMAGNAVTTGYGNVFVGDYAGPVATTGIFNTFVGQGAGELITTGSKNSILGKYSGNQGGLDIRTASNYIVLSDGDGNPRGVFDSSGNLLVGTTTQTGSFNVTYTGTSQPVSYNYASNASFTNAVVRSAMAGTSTSAQLFLGQNSNTSAVFYVNGGGAIFSTSTTITGISDVRFKENIRDLDDGLDVVMALKPRKFDWKEGKGANIKNARGFIAQEFEQVLPDLIGEWLEEAPEGEEPYKSVRPDLIPTLVKAIQQQQAIIEQLKADVDATKAELANLKGAA